MRVAGALAALFLLAAPGALHAQGTLRIGLNEDPGTLDPMRSFAFVDRVVFASLCDKLIDLDAKLNFVPQLATAWEWSPDSRALTLHLRQGVQFQDGTPLDAEAVRVNLERYRTAPDSSRKAEIKSVTSVEVVDPQTVRLHLASPDAPLVAVLSDRVGMILSPKALASQGKDIGLHPVCAGPFSFAHRVAQDRIELERFPGYWNAGAIHLDRMVFRPIPDTTVRLVNLQSGQLDMIERLAPTDAAAVKSNPHLRLVTSPSLAYRTISINLHHGPAADNPLGKDPRVREAFDKSLDRAAINQVAFNGQFIPSNQVEAPGSRYWNPEHPVPPRDLEGAKKLLAEAGVAHPSFTLIVGNDPLDGQIGQVIQSMAGEAGFDVKLQQMEANTLVAAAKRGDYQATLVIWSGRADPDGNVSIWMACDGFINWGEYCNKEFDALLARGRSITDPEARVPVYRQVADIYLRDRPQIILYHFRWLWGLSDRLDGFSPVPDGLIRPQGLRLKEH